MRNLIEYSENYINNPFEEIQVAFRKKKVLEIISKYEHSNILEIGCGLDPFFNCYQDFAKLVIVEPSTSFYDNAINQVKINGSIKSKVIIINDYLEGSICELQKHEFDFVIVSCLIHEIENISLFLENLRILIGKQTVVHIDVPNAKSFHRILAYEMGIIDSVFEMSVNNLRFQQQRIFDIATLSNLVKKHGFEIIDTGTYFLKPFTHGQMQALIENKIINKQVLEGLYKMTSYMPNMGSEIYINFKVND